MVNSAQVVLDKFTAVSHEGASNPTTNTNSWQFFRNAIFLKECILEISPTQTASRQCTKIKAVMKYSLKKVHLHHRIYQLGISNLILDYEDSSSCNNLFQEKICAFIRLDNCCYHKFSSISEVQRHINQHNEEGLSLLISHSRRTRKYH